MGSRFFETKNFIALSVLLLIAAVILTIIVQINSRRTFLDTHEENAKNLLNAVYLNVENEYKSITFYKNATFNLRKREVRNITTLALRSVQEYYKMSLDGTLTTAEAQKQAKRALNNFRYDSGIGYVWVNNNTRNAPELIVHPTMPDLIGKVLLDDEFNVASGINKNLFHAFIDICASEGEGYVDYVWPKPSHNGLTQHQPKISYVKLFKPWNWIIGSGVYIDDIEKEVGKKYDAVQQELHSTFGKIKLARNGYMFVVDSSYRVIIHPHLPIGDTLSNYINPATNQPLLPDISVLKQSDGEAIDYLWNKPPHDTNNFTHHKKMYIRYFQPLNWFIAASFYDDDIKRSANAVTFKLILLSVLLFGIFLFGTIILTRFIRKQHSTEEEVHRIDQLLKDVLAAASEVSIVATNPDGIITLFNSGAERMLGYTSEEVVGRHTPLLYYKKDEIATRAQELSAKYDTTVSGFDVCTVRTDSTGCEKRNWTFIRKDGTEVLVSLVVTAIMNSDGTSKGYLGIAQDITTQLRAERELRESRKMDAIGQLAGGVAHDFNNMLAGILSAAEMLQLGTHKNGELNELATIIVDAAKRSSELTAQLLAFSRKSNTISKAIDVHEAISNTIVLLKTIINKKTSVSVNLTAQQHTINGDPTLLQNVFLNIGINANYAMPNGGVISFESTTTTLDRLFCNNSTFNLVPGEYILITIKDTGSGIAPEHIDKIFEPFFTTKKQGEGTGLGLAAAYGTIQQHSGAILVDSPGNNQGTTFKILLPLTAQKSKTPPPPTHSVCGSGKILIVDDEEVIRLTTSLMLKKMGYSVIFAENGEKAIEQYLKNRHDIQCIILDMLMPVMDGKECFYKLKEIDPDVTVILCSGFSRDNSIQRMYNAGLAGFIQKPFEYSKLSTILAEITG